MGLESHQRPIGLEPLQQASSIARANGVHSPAKSPSHGALRLSRRQHGSDQWPTRPKITAATVRNISERSFKSFETGCTGDPSASNHRTKSARFGDLPNAGDSRFGIEPSSVPLFALSILITRQWSRADNSHFALRTFHSCGVHPIRGTEKTTDPSHTWIVFDLECRSIPFVVAMESGL